MLHEKSNAITTLAATKAFVNLFGRRYGKRRALLVVKRTKT
jgi:hypothetical protein